MAMTLFSDDTHKLYRLTYFSRATQAALNDIERAMIEILSASVRRNRDAEVTGALLFCGGWFLQALEGPRVKVGEVFARVGADRRHMEVKVLHAGLADKRRFAAWSMCGRQLSEADDAIVTLLETHKRFDPGTLSVAAALSLLSIVSDIKSRKVPTVEI